MKASLEKSKPSDETILLKQSGKRLIPPLYFPAISTISSRRNTAFLAEIVIKSKYPVMLLSAYDIYHDFAFSRQLISSIRRYSEKGNVLLLDSGGFESYWNNDKNWNFARYDETVCKIQPDIYGSFDVSAGEVVQATENEADQFNAIIRSGSVLAESEFFPIFHGSTSAELVSQVETFLNRFPTGIKFVAVPERECGTTLRERARTMLKIVKLTRKSEGHQHVHLLGCGQPLSLALYVYLGVKTFDSSDWLRSCFDNKSLTLTDFSYLELLDCKCLACKRISDPYVKVLLHNLRSYMTFTENIRKYHKENTLLQLLSENGIKWDFLKDL